MLLGALLNEALLSLSETLLSLDPDTVIALRAGRVESSCGGDRLWSADSPSEVVTMTETDGESAYVGVLLGGENAMCIPESA